MSIGFWQIAIVAVLIVLLFGRGKISSLMGDVAKGIKSFKKGMASDVTEDPETKQDLIFIQNPAKTKVIDLDHPIQENSREQKVAMGFIKWMNFSDEDFYVISEKDIMTIAPMSPSSIMMYKRWVRKEIDRLPEKEREVPMNSSMGLLDTVDNARQLLERIYKNPKLPDINQ